MRKILILIFLAIAVVPLYSQDKAYIQVSGDPGISDSWGLRLSRPVGAPLRVSWQQVERILARCLHPVNARLGVLA